MYKVSLYSSEGKTSPITDYLDKCSEKVRAKILRQFKYVQEYGLTPAIPNMKKLSNTTFWELRILGRDNIRIICTNLPNKEIIILHIFTKKKQKTPQKEISTALKRYFSLTNDI